MPASGGYQTVTEVAQEFAEPGDDRSGPGKPAARATTQADTADIQVIGTPSGTVTEMLRRQASAGVPLSVKPHHLGGFTR